MAEHTPGPWEFEREEGAYQIRMGSAVEDRGWYKAQHLVRWDHNLYESEDGCNDRGEDEQLAEAEANMRLMAAAPDLLDACRVALELLGPVQMNETNKSDPAIMKGLHAVLHLTAAIRKAEGEPANA